MSTMDNEVRILRGEFVVNWTVTHDTENGHGKVCASCDDERDDAAIHTSNHGNHSRENDIAMK